MPATRPRKQRRPPWAVELPEAYAGAEVHPSFAGFYPTREGTLFRDFCRGYLLHVKGRWAGKPVELELWQYLLVSELLRGRLEKRPAYYEGLVGLARKNSKSTLSSALALYGLVLEPALLGDGGAEVYAAAAAKDQARIVFGAAKRMVEKSPALLDWVKVYRDALYVPSTDATFRVLSSDAPLQHGLNPSLVIIDELHAHRDPELYFALTTGDAAREQSLVVSISTAGITLEGSILGDVYQRSQETEEGLFGLWLSVPDDQVDEPAAWKLANPASWVTTEYLERKRQQLRGRPSVFERLHLNRWTRAEKAWLPAGAWDELEDESVRLEPGDNVYVGLDLGVKHDTAAVALVGPEKVAADGSKKRPSEGLIFGAHPDAAKEPPPAHRLIEGDRIPLELLEDAVRELARTYNVLELAFDPWRFQRSAELLEAEGLPVLEFPQSHARMCPASSNLYEAVTEGRLATRGDRAERAHIESAVVRDVDARSWRLSKKDSAAGRPMDYSVALAMANDRAQAGHGGGFSIRFLGDEDEDDR